MKVWHAATVDLDLGPRLLEQLQRSIAQIWVEATVAEWLHGFNDYLDGVPPIDVIKRGRIGDVLAALELERA